MLPYEFEVIYQPGSKMGITDYLSRSPCFGAPKEPPDETELIVAMIKQLNQRKNRVVLQAVVSKWEADSVEDNRVEIENKTHEKISENEMKRENAKENLQTDWSQERQRTKRNFELPNEVIKRVCDNISFKLQPIRTLVEPIEKTRENKTDARSVDTKNSRIKVHSKPDSKTSRSNLKHLQVIAKVTMMNDDSLSTVSSSSIAAQKRDLEIQIANIQSQLHFLKREGQYRVNSVDDRILKYRPDSREQGPKLRNKRRSYWR